MKFHQNIFLLFLVLGCSQALDININNRNPFCFYLELAQNETMLIKYEVIGYKAEEFRMSVYDSEDTKANPIHTIQKEKASNYNLQTSEGKEYRVCFQSLDNNGKVLQFEFIKTNQQDENYVNDKTLEKSYNDVASAYYYMNDIFINLRHQFMKTDVQTNKSTEKKVKWCSIVKMVLMISITTIQIVFLTSLFKNYSPFGI